MDSSLPHRTHGASENEHAIPGLEYGVPSRELCERAVGGWERFLRRFAVEQTDQEGEA